MKNIEGVKPDCAYSATHIIEDYIASKVYI